MRALVVLLLPSFPLLTFVHCLEVDSPEVVETNGGEAQSWSIPSKTEQLIRRKKEALKLLFNSTDRKVPIIYNRNSDLFQQYLTARFTRIPGEEDASSEASSESEDRTERNLDVTTITSWGGPDESLAEQLVFKPKARQVKNVYVHPRVRKQSQKMIDIDSNPPPFEQQDFSAYVTLRTETDLEAAPAKRSSSNPVRDELRSFIQQLQSLDNFESVKLSTILPQESNSLSKEARPEEFEEDTNVTFFHNGADDPGLEGQFVISEAVPTTHLKSEPTKPTVYKYKEDKTYNITNYATDFQDAILPERIQPSSNFQRSAQPRPTHIPSLQGSLIHPNAKELAHEHNQSVKDGKVKSDKARKLTNVVQIGGTLYRSPNPIQAHPTPSVNSFQQSTSHHHSFPTTPSPVQVTYEPDPGFKLAPQSPPPPDLYSNQPQGYSPSQTAPNPRPNYEFQTSPSPPRSYYFEATPTQPSSPSQGVSSSAGILYRQGFGTTPEAFAKDEVVKINTESPIFTYKQPQRLTTPKYYMKLVTDQPYTPQPIAITVPPPAPTPPPPEPVHPDHQPDVPTSSPVYYKPLPSVQGFLVQDSPNPSKSPPSFKSYQSPAPSPSYYKKPLSSSSDSSIEADASNEYHAPAPKFVKHITESSPYPHISTKVPNQPLGYNKEVENTTPYPLVYGFKPVVNRF
eukprot:TCALIF_06881-PA protein Name:"Protein of unknown function" AED:0.09 eAED:0.09 QI:0/0/0.5/0.5/1/1/2/18/681